MDLKGKAAVVCGGGGFIGGYLVKSLLANGVNVIRSVDVKPMDQWYQVLPDVENLVADLKDKDQLLPRQPTGRRLSSNSPPTWAAWDSLRTTRRCAC